MLSAWFKLYTNTIHHIFDTMSIDYDQFFCQQDLTVDKTVTSLSVINSITNHDLESMLTNSYSSSSCYDYIGEERRKLMSEEISKINPFNKKRPPVTFYDKSMGTPFAGMTIDKVDRFLKRNCANFKRRFKRVSNH